MKTSIKYFLSLSVLLLSSVGLFAHLVNISKSDAQETFVSLINHSKTHVSEKSASHHGVYCERESYELEEEQEDEEDKLRHFSSHTNSAVISMFSLKWSELLKLTIFESGTHSAILTTTPELSAFGSIFILFRVIRL